MKRKWEEPRIEVQKFEANEYMAACYGYEETGVVVTYGNPTDGKLNTPGDKSSWNHQGFNDDDFDFLAGDDDTIPAGFANGWYGNRDSLSCVKYGQPREANGWYGNNKAPLGEGMANPVYYYGYWPELIDSTNCNQYDVGPNAS